MEEVKEADPPNVEKNPPDERMEEVSDFDKSTASVGEERAEEVGSSNVEMQMDLSSLDKSPEVQKKRSLSISSEESIETSSSKKIGRVEI